ncbi:hypothetical protein N440_1447 [Stenotrophomonas sp. CC22-02]|nr:hypothetical protein N440_1447 [Stenotrophomonas sp. CC22-02]
MGSLGRAAPCTRRSNSNSPSNSPSNGTSWFPVGWRGGSGCGRRRKPPDRPSRWRLCVRALAKQCFASKAPSPLGAWPRHPCRGHSRNRTHPAFDGFLLLLVDADLGRHGVGSHHEYRYLTDVSTKVDTHQKPREIVRGGAVSECGVSAAWARGMPRAGWAGRPTPVLPCAQERAHEQAAAKPPRTGLRRPRTPTPPRQTTDNPLLLLLLLLLLLSLRPLQVQGCKPCRTTPYFRGR